MKTLTITVVLTFTFLFSVFICNAQGSGYALDFDGTNDYLETPYSSALDFDETQSFTVELWYKQHSHNTLGEFLISRGSPQLGNLVSYNYKIATLSQSSNLLSVIISGSSGQQIVATSTPVSLNEWHHVALVYDASLHLLSGVLDGVSFGSMTVSIEKDFSDVYIGRYANGGYNFDGSIDEVRIWNRALTPAEIQENMCQKLTGTEPGLVAYYRMDEGVDNTCSGGEDVCDLTGNGNHGTKY